MSNRFYEKPLPLKAPLANTACRQKGGESLPQLMKNMDTRLGIMFYLGRPDRGGPEMEYQLPAFSELNYSGRRTDPVEAFQQPPSYRPVS